MSALQAAAGRSVQLWGEEVKLAKVMANDVAGLEVDKLYKATCTD